MTQLGALSGLSTPITGHRFPPIHTIMTITAIVPSSVISRGGTDEITRYRYDLADRLEEVAYPDQTTSYTYDFVSNRLTEQSLSATDSSLLVDRTYTYNSRNQVLTLSDQPRSGRDDYLYLRRKRQPEHSEHRLASPRPTPSMLATSCAA